MLQLLEELLTTFLQRPGPLLSGLGSPMSLLDDLVMALRGLGRDFLRIHARHTDGLFGLTSGRRGEAVGLALGLPHHREHVTLRVLTQLTELGHRLVEELGASGPGVTAQGLCVAPCLFHRGIGLGHRLRSPLCGIEARPLPHRLGGFPSRLQHRGHFPANAVEFGGQVAVGILPKPGIEAIPLLPKLLDFCCEDLDPLSHLARIESPQDGAELSAVDLPGSDVRFHLP